MEKGKVNQTDIDKVLVWFDKPPNSKQDKVIERLDESVHGLYSVLASAVNNAGIEEQIRFIFEQCGDKAWLELGRALDEWEFKI